MTDCEKILCHASAPPSDEPADRWIERNIYLGGDSDLQGKVSFEFLPMARFFLRACQNPRVRKITAIISTQSAKTKTTEFYLMWKLINAPGPTAWYMDVDESAKVFSQTRLENDLNGCELIQPYMPTTRERKKWKCLQLSSMDLHVLGANNKRNRERISLETIICDERRNFPRGSMQSIRSRYKAFRHYKEITISCAGEDQDDLHVDFRNGSQHFFFWACLACGHRQPFRFSKEPSPFWPDRREKGGLKWDDNEQTHPREDVWDVRELHKTVRYECEQCGHLYRNWEKPKLLATMTEENNFGAVQLNPMASPEHISLHWGELYMPWAECDWERTAEKFVRAHVALAVNRDVEPLKVFVQENLGEPWKQPSDKPVETEVLKLRKDYVMGERWQFVLAESGNYTELLTVDVQNAYLVYVLRQWKKGGASRLIDCGRLLEFEDLRTYQQDNKVRSQCVFIDYPHRNKEVSKACLRFGWNPMIGDDAAEYTQNYYDQKENKQVAVKVPWKPVEYDPHEGTTQAGRMTLRRFTWSNPHYMDQLYFWVLKGKWHAWELPANAPREYYEQLMNYECIDHIDPNGSTWKEWKSTGRHDFADCCLMQLAAADICYITKGQRI